MRIILLISLLSLYSCGTNRLHSENERMKEVRKQDKIMFKKVMKARRQGARFVSKLSK